MSDTTRDGSLSLTVLGADGSYPGPGGAGSGYLVRAGGFSVWMDAGPGTLANLQLHLSLLDLDAVVVSHEHPDHWSDLDGLYVALRYYLGRRGLPVYAPAGVRRLVRGDDRAGTMEWRTIGDGSLEDLGPMRWRWSRTDHPVETLAARIDYAGAALGYSADTGPGWSLAELGEGLDLALVEASFLSDKEGSLAHLSGRQAGAAAREAGARRLVLTHVVPGVAKGQLRAEAEEAFGGPVEMASIGDRWDLQNQR